MLIEAATAGSECVDLSLHHVRHYSQSDLRGLAEAASARGILLLASGDAVGEARNGDRPSVGVSRIETSLERAVVLGSPILKVFSGFCWTDLAARPDLIEAERRYVVDVLRHAAHAAAAVGVRLALENASDFTLDQYAGILGDLDDTPVEVFLDIVNPIAVFEDPLPAVERLAPLAAAAHVKDYRLPSIPSDDGYHRRGFEVRWCYPGEGVMDVPPLIDALLRRVRGDEFYLVVEGLDSRADVADQVDRLRSSFGLLRGCM